LIGAGYGSAGRTLHGDLGRGARRQDHGRQVDGEKLVPRVESLKIGTSIDPSADYGPLVTREALNRVKNYVEIGIKEGATLAVDGRNFKMQATRNGFYMGGCLFDKCHKGHADLQGGDLRSGAVGSARPRLQGGLEPAVDHDYGNGVAIFTRDGDAARDFAAKVNVGMVGINVPIPVPIAYYTFGGWKKSGFAISTSTGRIRSASTPRPRR